MTGTEETRAIAHYINHALLVLRFYPSVKEQAVDDAIKQLENAKRWLEAIDNGNQDYEPITPTRKNQAA